MLKLSKHIVLNTALLTFVLITFSFFSTAQNNEGKAQQFFKDGKYMDALPIYQELNVLYPNDYIIQYNYGVCLSETNNLGNKARKLLLQSTQGEVPPQVFFYIGKNYHALNDFKTANIYYIRFDNNAKNKIKKTIDFNQIWEKCKLNINPFVIQNVNEMEKREKSIDRNLNKEKLLSANDIEYDTITSLQSKTDTLYPIIEYQSHENVSSVTNDAIDKIQNESIITKSETDKSKQKGKAVVKIEEQELHYIPKELIDTTFNFILSSEIYYQKINQFKTEHGQKFFIEGWNNSIELKSLLKEIDSLRNEYNLSKSQTKKTKISEKVLALEMETIQLKTNSDKNYLDARSAEIEYWDKAPAIELNELIAENDSLNQLKTVAEILLIEDEDLKANDTLVLSNDTTIIIAEVVTDNLSVIYKIQIGAYSKGLPEYIDRLYKKLSAFRKIDHYTDDREITVYTIGELTSFGNAIKLQNQIRQEGVKDAFVVAYNNGKRITLGEAKEITNNE